MTCHHFTFDDKINLRKDIGIRLQGYGGFISAVVEARNRNNKLQTTRSNIRIPY